MLGRGFRIKKCCKMSLNPNSVPSRMVIPAETSSILERVDKVPDRVVSEFKFYSDPASNVSPDLMLASTSQILTEPPTQIKRYVEGLSSSSLASGLSSQTVHVSTGANVSMVKERVILACHKCDYKTFHRHALDRHIQVLFYH